MLGDSMRGVRFLLEYAKAEESLRRWSICSIIVLFGSARVLEGRRAGPGATTASLPAGAQPRSGARSARWYGEAWRFGRIASERGGALPPIEGRRESVVATGGGPGIVEAANRGAPKPARPRSLQHPPAVEQGPNAFTTPDLTFQFHYFAMLKMHLAMCAAALVVFPGGFGTFDELFEVLTLRQTNKASEIPIVLFDQAYWEKVVSFEGLIEEGMIEEKDLSLFGYADRAEEAWSYLVRHGLKVPGSQEKP